jgi:hypothetical protein
MNFQNHKFEFVELAVKALSLRPDLLGNISTDDALIHRVLDFAEKFATAMPPQAHEPELNDRTRTQGI